jgi:hypothetical protein
MKTRDRTRAAALHSIGLFLVAGTLASSLAPPAALAFDSHGLPRGVYFVRLETPTASAATKLELLR